MWFGIAFVFVGVAIDCLGFIVWCCFSWFTCWLIGVVSVFVLLLVCLGGLLHLIIMG